MRFRRSPLFAGILVLASSLMLAACSSGGGTPSALPSGGTPTQNLAAQVLNLKSQDFPASWKTISSKGGPNVVRASINGCLLQQHTNSPAAAAVSSNFLDTSSGQETGSQVAIYESVAEAEKAARLGASGPLSSCLASAVTAGLQRTLPSNERVTDVKTASFPSGMTVPLSFGQRVLATISYPDKNGKQGAAQVYIDVVGFAHGSALVEGEFENPATFPSATLESSTMATLLKRAQG